jgi:hypothetical protein
VNQVGIECKYLHILCVVCILLYWVRIIAYLCFIILCCLRLIGIVFPFHCVMYVVCVVLFTLYCIVLLHSVVLSFCFSTRVGLLPPGANPIAVIHNSFIIYVPSQHLKANYRHILIIIIII